MAPGATRLQRLRRVLAQRQPDLTVLMDGVRKSLNLGAVTRTAEAAGCLEVHAVVNQDDSKHVLKNGVHKRSAKAWAQGSQDPKGAGLRRPRNKELLSTSKGADRWVQVRVHEQLEKAVQCVREQGMQIITADLAPEAVDFRQIDYTRPTCVLVGAEAEGVSDAGRAFADHIVTIPMVGMVQSLNVSAATAIVLYEAQRQREAAGMYEEANSALSAEEQGRLLVRFFQPEVAALCDAKGIDYPKLDEDGDVIPDAAWSRAFHARASDKDPSVLQ
ncbi:23S rRNA Guanosine-2'-O--methyltransferase [Hondaea fermentalgiana]|uniref:23S rRNA Guanosine-2'-O--methyltransferase n=1 Tax=Hondaea fermentalgiana TaxID=2315210 RepID=A0A2R5GVU6_9STRA|nr:23S rRNA Guanosine-2'-O--methyltransferase [Hondaea fermentalgiana]|eukprot:GBG32044.1 23S rRNA Guanosine-2'-O--methyltransferase [Hondaea fermentalgiana]